jgi:hypothetical protein
MFTKVLAKLNRQVFPNTGSDASDVEVFVEVDVTDRQPKWCSKYLRGVKCESCKYEHSLTLSHLGVSSR